MIRRWLCVLMREMRTFVSLCSYVRTRHDCYIITRLLCSLDHCWSFQTNFSFVITCFPCRDLSVLLVAYCIRLHYNEDLSFLRLVSLFPSCQVKENGKHPPANFARHDEAINATVQYSLFRHATVCYCVYVHFRLK